MTEDNKPGDDGITGDELSGPAFLHQPDLNGLAEATPEIVLPTGPELITFANELAAPDYADIPGINSLKGVFGSANDKRVSWMTRRFEVEEAFEAYGLESPGPTSRLGEITMLRMLRNHLTPQACPSCVNKTYDDTRWHKVTDRGEPIRVAMTPTAQRAFGDIVERVMAYWVNHTDKLQFELVGMRQGYDAILESDKIDGARGTLGYVSRLENGDLGNATVRLRMDSDEQWSSFMLWSVLVHEFGHLIGIGHAPAIREHIRDIMFPIYYHIAREIMGWSLEQVHDKYGEPEMLMT